MTELSTASVVPDVTNKVLHPPPQRSTLKVLASCAGFAVFAAVVAVAVTFGAGWRGHMGHEVPSYLEADGEDVMRQRVFGTCVAHVQDPLRWGVDRSEADWVCCENRHYAERAGRWTSTAFLTEHTEATVAASGPITFYDSVTGLPLFKAPIGRSWHDFVRESRAHGWPSFRDAELLPAYVRILPNGETVSVNGTHLGHNLPDSKGNRYCINLCSVAGLPAE